MCLYWNLIVSYPYANAFVSGLPSQTFGTTTPLPYSSRAPPQATRPELDHAQIQNHSILSHTPLFALTANISSSTPGVLEQVDGTKPTTVTSSSLPKSTFTTSTSKTLLTTEFSTVSPTLENSTLKQRVSPNDSSRVRGTFKPVVNSTKPIVFVPREYAEIVPQNSQKDLFVRRKHKEPIQATKDKSTHTIMSLRSNHTDGLSSESSIHYIKNHSRVSETVKNAVKVFKSKVKSHRSALRQELSKTVAAIVRQNKTKKMSMQSLFRKRPITMGIPASSTVLLTQKTTSTPVPTAEVYNSQESDEYYTSYGDYIDIPVVGFNSSGNWV